MPSFSSCFFHDLLNESNVSLSIVPLSKWERTRATGQVSHGKKGPDISVLISSSTHHPAHLSLLYKPRWSRSGTWWWSTTVAMMWKHGKAPVVVGSVPVSKVCTVNIQQTVWRNSVPFSSPSGRQHHLTGWRWGLGEWQQRRLVQFTQIWRCRFPELAQRFPNVWEQKETVERAGGKCISYFEGPVLWRLLVILQIASEHLSSPFSVLGIKNVKIEQQC